MNYFIAFINTGSLSTKKERSAMLRWQNTTWHSNGCRNLRPICVSVISIALRINSFLTTMPMSTSVRLRWTSTINWRCDSWRTRWGYIERDPTRKAIIKGKTPREKKQKYLNQFELQRLLSTLDLPPHINWDWFILLIAKTGIRFSEVSSSRQRISISRIRNSQSQRRGITKEMADLCQQRIDHR